MSLNDLHSWLVTLARLGRGLRVRPGTQRPALPLELFEYEACPYCRKVRETLSELDLDYVARPCAQGSPNRAQVKARGGRAMFPYLVDPNGPAALYESEDIITYLHAHYGRGRGLASKLLAPLNTLGSTLASALRPNRVRQVPARRPAEPLVLWQYEGCPYCRKVRESLCRHQLDHHVRTVARGSGKRPELKALGGRVQLPYLVDPNTGAALYESDEIVRYIRATYGTGPDAPP